MAAIRGESGKQVAQWMLAGQISRRLFVCTTCAAGLREQQLEHARNYPDSLEDVQQGPPPPGQLTGQRTHVFTALTMASVHTRGMSIIYAFLMAFVIIMMVQCTAVSQNFRD